MPIFILDEARDLGVIRDSSTVERSGHGDGDVHAGVIVRAVVVDEGAHEVRLLEHGEGFEGLAPREEVGALDALAAGEEVVELGARPVVGGLPPLVEGEHDGEPGAEVGGGLEEVFALGEGFAHEEVLVPVEVPYGLFQVSHAAVDKFRALAARAAAEIIPLNDCDFQSSCRSIQRDTCTRSSTTNDQHVVLDSTRLRALPQISKLLLPRLDLGEPGKLERAIGGESWRGHGG